MRLKYILFGLIALLMVSCYDDKGNYDYTTFNDIEVNIELEEREFPIGAELTLTPELIFRDGIESKNLAFQWTYINKEISTDRVLKWNVNPIGEGDVVLYVTDLDTGIKYIGKTRVIVTPKYAAGGWMILSEKDGHSMLSYVKTGNSIKEDEATKKRYIEGTSDVDAYRTSNGEILDGKPIKVYEHFRNAQWGADVDMGNYWILQSGTDNNAIDIDGTSFVKDATLESMFLGGTYPNGFKPYDMVDMIYITLAISTDGKVYSRKKDDINLHNSGYFLDLPMTYNGAEIDGRKFVRAPYTDCAFTMFYNEPTNNYLMVTTKNLITSGEIYPIKADPKDYEAKPGFSKLEDLGDKKPIYIGSYYTSGGYSPVGYVSILKSDVGKYYLQDFELSGVSSATATIPTLVDQKELNLGNVVDGVSKNVFYLSFYRNNTPYLFISKGRELWWIYLRDGNYALKKVRDFEADITTMNSEIYGGRQLMVGLSNGKVHVLDVSWDAMNGVYGDNTLLYTLDGLGSVTQVVYKTGFGNGWGFDIW